MAKKNTRKRTAGKKISPIELRPSMDAFLPKGRFSYMLGDLEGNPLWAEPRHCDNTVVTAGRSWTLKHIMSSQSANVSSQIISALAIGTGTAAPTTSDTLLGSELVRVTVITETDNSTSAVPHCIWAASFNSTQGNATAANSGLDEFGLFNTSSSNTSTMLARATTASFAKTTSNTLTVSYTISI